MNLYTTIVRLTVSMMCLLVVGSSVYLQSGCARIVPPSGGPKDTLPPVLVKSVPADSILHMPLIGNRILLTFDEYVQLDNAASNLIVNPTLKLIPIVENKLKVVSVKIKDTLEANTTYTLNFGNSIKDVDEGNIFKHFTYIFSTGSYLDSGTLAGKVRLAKNSKADSTLLVILHRHMDDSAVAKEAPRYVARVDTAGRFRFRNIAPGTYAIYAIKDEGDKKYHDKSDAFAFYDHPVKVTGHLSPADSIFLFAYAELSEKPKTGAVTPPPPKKEKKKEALKLHVATSLLSGKQDLLADLFVTYDQPILKYDSTQLQITDTLYNAAKYTLTVDSSRMKFRIHYLWKEDSSWKLVIGKGFATDTSGVSLQKSDTLSFKTQKESEYGLMRLRLKNFDLSRHPVVQLVQNDKIVDSIPVTHEEIYRPLYHPGEYQLRVLYDTNQNGTWDPGSFFGVHRQPEIVVLPKTPSIKIRGNGWENEYDVIL